MSELSKLDTLLQKTHIKVLLVLRLDMCRSILSFSTIAHQMWRDHLFSQRNRTTERREGVGLGVTGCVYVCVNVCVCACVCVGGGEAGGVRGKGGWPNLSIVYCFFKNRVLNFENHSVNRDSLYLHDGLAEINCRKVPSTNISSFMVRKMDFWNIHWDFAFTDLFPQGLLLFKVFFPNRYSA